MTTDNAETGPAKAAPEAISLLSRCVLIQLMDRDQTPWHDPGMFHFSPEPFLTDLTASNTAIRSLEFDDCGRSLRKWRLTNGASHCLPPARILPAGSMLEVPHDRMPLAGGLMTNSLVALVRSACKERRRHDRERGQCSRKACVNV